MLKVEKLVVGELSENCYLVYDSKTREAAIIDPGDSADYIERRISDLELVPKMILCTHGHFDHTMAVLELQLSLDIPFLISKKDEFLLKRMDETAVHFTKVSSGPAPIISKSLENLALIKIGNQKLKVISTPGHTPGSSSFYSKEEEMVFVGDLIFEEGAVGRTDHSYGNQKELEKSIKKILSLPDDTAIFSGHGEETTVYYEKKFHQT